MLLNEKIDIYFSIRNEEQLKADVARFKIVLVEKMLFHKHGILKFKPLTWLDNKIFTLTDGSEFVKPRA